MTTVTAVLEAQAATAPDALAIYDRGRRLSYAELDATGRRLATGLAEIGIGAGDRVGFWLPNIAAYPALLFACARLGAIAVSVNTRFRATETGDIVGRAGCKALILWPSFKDIAFLDILGEIDAAALDRLETAILYDEDADTPEFPLSAALRGKRVVSYADLAARPQMTADAATPEAGFVVFTTSGTTAAPKFVLHSQRGIATHAAGVAQAFGYTDPDSVILQALPLCGTFGLTQAMAVLAAGRPMITMPVFDAEAAARLMRECRVTHMNGADEMFLRLLEVTPGALPFPDFREGGFAAFSPEAGKVVAAGEARGMRLFGIWGMSELQALFARWPATEAIEMRARMGGVPVSAAAEIRVRDPESGALLAHGETGELEIRAPSRMLGYFGDDAATKKAVDEDGFLRSGDLGYTEAAGGFVFLSRMGDVLRLGGFLVNPAEIEAHIEAHPSIDAAQVVGVETADGIRPYAFVVPAEGAAHDAETLRAHCAAGLAKFKLPVAFHALDSFPVTESANGVKIRREVLRRWAVEASR